MHSFLNSRGETTILISLSPVIILLISFGGLSCMLFDPKYRLKVLVVINLNKIIDQIISLLLLSTLLNFLSKFSIV
jgi:hypothetical protein